jgi:hypothetical protein
MWYRSFSPPTHKLQFHTRITRPALQAIPTPTSQTCTEALTLITALTIALAFSPNPTRARLRDHPSHNLLSPSSGTRILTPNSRQLVISSPQYVSTIINHPPRTFITNIIKRGKETLKIPKNQNFHQAVGLMRDMLGEES